MDGLSWTRIYPQWLESHAAPPCHQVLKGSQEGGAWSAAQLYFLVFACGTHLNLWLKQSACPGPSCDHLPPQTASVHQRNGWHESIARGLKILQSWLLLSSRPALTWRRQKLRHEPSCRRRGGEVWCYCLVREQPSPTGDSPAWACHSLSQKMHREALCHPSPEGQECHRPIFLKALHVAPPRAFGSDSWNASAPGCVSPSLFLMDSFQTWASSHTGAPLLFHQVSQSPCSTFILF